MSPTTDVRPNAWLRRPRRIFWFVASLLALAVLTFAMILPPAARSAADGDVGGALSAAAIALLLAAPYLYFSRAIARAGLWIGTDGIVIRGPLRTRRVRGNSAVSFAAGVQPGAGNGTPCPILTTSDGSRIGIWALGREGLVWNFNEYLDELKPLCDELNVQLEELYPDHVQTLIQPSPAAVTRLR